MISNGPLASGSSYRFSQRGLDAKRKVVVYEEWSQEVVTPIGKIAPTDDSNVGLIVGIIVALVIVLVIVSAVLFYLRRRREKPADDPGKYVSYFYRTFGKSFEMFRCAYMEKFRNSRSKIY